MSRLKMKVIKSVSDFLTNIDHSDSMENLW